MRSFFCLALVTASGAALAQSGNKGDVCAIDDDCKGVLICAQQVCANPPEPQKPLQLPAVSQPVSRVEVSLAPEVGVSTFEQSDVITSDIFFGANLTAAYTMVPALALVTAVDLRYVHPSDGRFERYLSLSGGLRFQTKARVFALDLLVGWTQLFAYQTVNGVPQNSASDGTGLTLLGHVRVFGPVELQARITENLFEGIKVREVGIGLGVRL